MLFNNLLYLFCAKHWNNNFVHIILLIFSSSYDEDGIKIAQRNINNLRYADDTTLMAESKEERKSLLMKVKELA